MQNHIMIDFLFLVRMRVGYALKLELSAEYMIILVLYFDNTYQSSRESDTVDRTRTKPTQ